MPAPFKENERIVIRNRLISRAIEALARGGLNSTSISDLVHQAGIAKGSFYTFYPSKEHLFIDALEEVEARYRKVFMSASSLTGTPLEKFNLLLYSALELVEKEPALQFIDGSAVERLSRALPPERLEEHAAADLRATEDLLSSWKAQGLVHDYLGIEELAGLMYTVFLVGSGLRGLPLSLQNATRRVFVEAMAAKLAKEHE